MTLAGESELDALAHTMRWTGKFVYANSLTLVLVSVGWFLASLPVLTIGPATLGAYVAIKQLNSDYNRIDRAELFGVVRERFVAAALFGLFPLMFLAIAGLYFQAYRQDGTTLAAVVFFVALYIALYGFLILIPTFTGLANRKAPSDAIRDGIGWVSTYPTLALLAGLITVMIATVTLLLTIAFVLAFAGIAFSFQFKMVTATEEIEERSDTQSATAA